MKRILITGATGFLGNHLLDALTDQQFRISVLCRKTPAQNFQKQGVTYIEGDIEDPYSLSAAFKHTDIVIHAAALVSVRPEDNERMYSVNVLGTRNVVNAVLESDVKRLIYVSSIAAIGGVHNPGKIMDESTVWNGPSEGYGFTKYCAELEVFRATAEGMEVDIINPSVIIAPPGSKRTSGLLMKLALKRIPFVPDGIVNLVDARDVAMFIREMLGKDGSGKRYILNGFTLTWKEFFGEVSRRTGRPIKYFTIPTRLAIWLTAIQEFMYFIMFRSPLLTRAAVKMATSGNRYSTEKATGEAGFQFRSAENTLDWICPNPEILNRS